ncbi:MAG: hypothetical protein HY904_10540 [Deltaproteobacteria bacterium]|nr:hypothetical protein [Deltaproteobacteria bacterium]
MSRLSWLVAVAVAVGCAQSGDEDLKSFTARLYAEQSEVAFPETEAGHPVDASAVFMNDGTGATTAWARVEGGGLSVVLLTPRITVSPGETASVDLRLIALDAGDVAATLVVRHDGQAGPDGSRTLRIPVRGRVRPPPSCDDGNPCTFDQADPSVGGGCVHFPAAAACDDGNACTDADSCVAGRCVGRPVICEDGITCTLDTCDAARGCVHLPTAARCADDDPCTDDACDPGVGADPRGCRHPVSPNGTLCGAPACDLVSMCVAGNCTPLPTPEGFPCDDGNPCTSGDTCHAGACLPGPGGSLTLGPPVMVHDVMMDDAENAFTSQAWEGPVRGLYPVRVDGVRPLMTQVTTGLSSLVVWRGTDSPWEGCHMAPAHCTEAPVCGQSGVVQSPRTDLALTWVGPAGDVLAHHVLDPTDAYAALSAQVVGSAQPMPGFSVWNAAFTAHGDALSGAVLLRFADGCSGCMLVGAEQTDQERVCMPAGTALLLVQGGVDGLHVTGHAWVGSDYVYAVNAVSGWLKSAEGLPLLGTATDGIRTVALVADGDGGCPPNADCDATFDGLTLRAFVRETQAPASVAPMVSLSEATWTVPMGWPGVQGNVLDLGVDLFTGDVCATWTQQASGFTPPEGTCFPEGEPLRDAWRACLSPNDDGPPSVRSASLVHQHTLLPTGNAVRWQRLGFPGEVCAPYDDVTLDPVAGEPVPLLHRAESLSLLRAIRVASFQDIPVMAGVDVAGRWVLAGPGFETAGGFGPNLDSRIFPEDAPQLGTDASAAAMAALAEAGLYRDSFPLTALVVATLQCGDLPILPPPPP